MNSNFSSFNFPAILFKFDLQHEKRGKFKLGNSPVSILISRVNSTLGKNFQTLLHCQLPFLIFAVIS